MLKTYLYIPDQLEEKIIYTSKSQNKSKAEVMRQALQEGLTVLEQQKIGGAEVLLKIAEIGKKHPVQGPKDGALNHDYYLWGLPKKDKSKKL